MARGSAKSIFAVIDRISKIDPINNGGEKIQPNDVNGHIEFRNVFFSYPSRSDVQVSHDLSMTCYHCINCFRF